MGRDRGCLVANFGSEMPGLSESIRDRLVEVFRALTEPFTEALRAGQHSGDVRDDCEAIDLAVLALAGWHGAVLRAKVERSGEPMRRYGRTLRRLIAASRQPIRSE